MKLRKVFILSAGVLLGVFLCVSPFLPGKRSVGLGVQRWTSEQKLKQLAAGLIAYAQDHAENFPPSLGSLSDPQLEAYGLGSDPYVRGDQVRLFVPSDPEPSPLVREVFSPHAYLATRDRCHLVVFERPGLWDDHTVAYLDLDLKGRWDAIAGGNPAAMTVHRVSEAQFAELIAKLDSAVGVPSPADALVGAAERGDTGQALVLLDRGVPVDARDHRGWSALAIATQNARSEVVELLLAKGADPNLRDGVGKGRTALMRAANLGFTGIVEALLTHGVEAGLTLEDGSTALMEALPHPRIVQRLLDAGADLHGKLSSGRSPLLMASARGYAGTVEVLIGHGADLPAEGLRCLEEAARNGHAGVIATLLAHGVSADGKFLGQCLSTAYAHPGAMEALIAAGADVNARCRCAGGRTALMVCALNGCRKSVGLLIGAGADLNVRDDRQHTVLDLALASARSDWMPSGSAGRKRLGEIIGMLQSSGARESGLKVEWPEPR